METTYQGITIRSLSSRPSGNGRFYVVSFFVQETGKIAYSLYLLPGGAEALDEGFLLSCLEDLTASGLEAIEKPTFAEFCANFYELTDPEAKKEYERAQKNKKRLEALDITQDAAAEIWESLCKIA